MIPFHDDVRDINLLTPERCDSIFKYITSKHVVVSDISMSEIVLG